MARRRFYAPPSAFNTKLASVSLAADEARHLRDVLRLTVGADVSVFNGAGQEFHCRVVESRRDRAELSVVEETVPLKPESPLELTLAVALLKGEKFDLVVQKATELGVCRIIPVVTKLADIRLRDKSDSEKRVARWQRIALEAAKQSGRARLPSISEPVSFTQLIAAEPDTTRIVFTEREGKSLDFALSEGRVEVKALTALVGSEGGWTDEELKLASNSGWLMVTLGGRTLRAETAAIAVATLLQHLHGDLR